MPAAPRHRAMTLNQLEYFTAVCRSHSINKAASELFVSQPTISVALRDLESEFSIKLFHHGKNRLTLTQDGEVFYQKAEHLLTQVHAFSRAFTRRAQPRVLRIGFDSVFGPSLLPDFYAALRKESDLPLSFIECGTEKAAALLDSDELDAAFLSLDFYSTDKFESLAMVEEEYVFCIPKTHPLSQEEAITFEMLKEEPLLVFGTGAFTRGTASGSIDSLARGIAARFQTMGIRPNIHLETNQLSTLEAFLQGGRAGAFLPSTLPLDRQDLVLLPIKPRLSHRLGLAWKKGQLPHDQLAQFLEFARKYQVPAKGWETSECT